MALRPEPVLHLRPVASVARVDRDQPARERWPYWMATGTVALGLLVTAALTLLSHSIYTRNEKRLLELRGREVASVISQAQPAIQTTFASAAAFADATHGNVAQFRRFARRGWRT